MAQNTKKNKFKRIPLRAVGRPTKYKKEFAQMLLDYFDVDPYQVKVYGKDKKLVKILPVRFPSIERFAILLNVDPDTISIWANAKDENGNHLNPEFFGAYHKAKAMQKEILVANTLQGLYQSNFAIFVATNYTDMLDRKQIDSDVNVEGNVTGFNYVIPTNKDDTDKTDPADVNTLGETA